MSNPRNANKKYFDFDHDVPLINTLINAVTFTGNILSENCELEHLGWNTVHLFLAFHTQYIVYAALATSYGLLISQQQKWPSSLLETNRKLKLTSLH